MCFFTKAFALHFCMYVWMVAAAVMIGVLILFPFGAAIAACLKMMSILILPLVLSLERK